MAQEFECPSPNDNRCDVCFALARSAFLHEFPGSSTPEGQSLSGEAFKTIRMRLEQTGDVTQFSCERRRERAVTIGNNVAKQYDSRK